VKLYQLHREQFAAAPLSEVFAFFAQPENLAKITPDSLGFIIRTPTPIVMKPGAEIQYTIRVNGIPLCWTTIISEYEPETRFVDEQRRGPYAFWKHTHSFVATEGGTLIIDDVSYALPFGWIGQLAHSLFVKKKLSTIFDFRAKVIERHFNSPRA